MPDHAVVVERLRVEQSRKNAEIEDLKFKVLSLEERVEELAILQADLYQVTFHMVYSRIVGRVRSTEAGVKVGELTTRDPIRAIHANEGGAIIQTRQHQVEVRGLAI